MNFKLRNGVMALAVGAAIGMPSLANAAPGINFSTTGTGMAGAVVIDRMNWTNQTVLAASMFTDTASDTVSGILYGHGQLSSLNFGAAGVGTVPGGSAGTPVFTYQFSIEVSASINTIKGADGATLTFADNLVFGATNHFTMYYDPDSEVDLSTGAGFGPPATNQSAILSGKLTLNTKLGSSFNDSSATPGTIISELDTFTPNPAGPWTIGGSGSLNMNIDVCNATEVLNAANPTCFGNPVDVVDDDFFPNSTLDSLTIDLNLNQGIQSFFDQFQPPSAVHGVTPNFGSTLVTFDHDGNPVTPDITRAINDYNCGSPAAPTAEECDMLFQGQNGLSRFFGTHVPEPGSLALLGLGLAGLGLAGRRKRRLFQGIA